MICVIATIVILTKLGPTKFEVTGLTLSPTEAKVGQTVTVSADIKNVGESTGTYKAILTIDGVETDSKNITIEAGETKTVIFTVVKDVEGTYTIGIGRITRNLRVTPPLTVSVSKSQILINDWLTISGSVDFPEPQRVLISFGKWSQVSETHESYRTQTAAILTDIKGGYSVEVKAPSEEGDWDIIVSAGGSEIKQELEVYRERPRVFISAEPATVAKGDAITISVSFPRWEWRVWLYYRSVGGTWKTLERKIVSGSEFSMSWIPGEVGKYELYCNILACGTQVPPHEVPIHIYR